MPESELPDSPFERSEIPPDFQVVILTIKFGTEDEWVRIGTGFFMKPKHSPRPALFTASHVIRDSNRMVRIIGPKGRMELPTTKFSFVTDFDAAYKLCDLQEIQKLGCSVGRPAPVAGTVYANAQAKGRRSTGKLTEMKEAFGMLLFKGSTERGFSGCAYYVNKQIYGLHTTGCVKGGEGNVGISASMLTTLVFPREEDSDEQNEFEIHYLERKGDLQSRVVAPGLVQWRDRQGNYRLSDADDYNRWISSAHNEAGRFRMFFRKPEPEEPLTKEPEEPLTRTLGIQTDHEQAIWNGGSQPVYCIGEDAATQVDPHDFEGKLEESETMEKSEGTKSLNLDAGASATSPRYPLSDARLLKELIQEVILSLKQEKTSVMAHPTPTPAPRNVPSTSKQIQPADAGEKKKKKSKSRSEVIKELRKRLELAEMHQKGGPVNGSA